MEASERGQGEGSSNRGPYVILCVDASRIALPLPVVERVIQAVELTHLPGAPDIVLGVLNLQGRVIPVFNLRRRFGLAERALALSDHIVIARARRRPVALVADTVSGVTACAEPDWIDAARILPRLDHVAGVVRRDDGLLLVHDLDRFLSLDEEAGLEAALVAGGGP